MKRLKISLQTHTNRSGGSDNKEVKLEKENNIENKPVPKTAGQKPDKTVIEFDHDKLDQLLAFAQRL